MGNLPVVWARFLFGIPPPFLPLYILTQSTRRGGAAKGVFFGGKEADIWGSVGRKYRCNNVLWISGTKNTKHEDTAMEG